MTYDELGFYAASGESSRAPAIICITAACEHGNESNDAQPLDCSGGMAERAGPGLLQNGPRFAAAIQRDRTDGGPTPQHPTGRLRAGWSELAVRVGSPSRPPGKSDED